MSLLKSVGTLTLGNGLAQAINLLSFVVLTRLYSPEEFGVYAVILGIATITGTASSCRYEMTILLPKSNSLAKFASTVSLALSSGIQLILLILYATLALFYETSWLTHWYFIPLIACPLSLINITSFIQNRDGRYKKLASIQIAKAALLLIFGVIFSYFHFQKNAIVISMAATASLIGTYLLYTEYQLQSIKAIAQKRLKAYAWIKKHNKFLKFSTPAIFVNSTANQTPIFLLSFFYGDQMAGFYTIIHRVIMSPVILVSGAVNKVYMQKVTALRARSKAISHFTQTLIMKSLIPSLTGSALLIGACYAGTLQTIFGEQWEALDYIATIMTPVFLISFLSKSVAGFSVLGKNELGLLYQLFLLSIVSASIPLAYYAFNKDELAYIALSVALTTAYSMQLISILRISRTFDRSLPHAAV